MGWLEEGKILHLKRVKSERLLPGMILERRNDYTWKTRKFMRKLAKEQ